MSRKALAAKLKTTRVRVWRIETGVTPILADDLEKWARALRTTAAELVA